MSEQIAKEVKMINLTIDGRPVTVPAGTNLIEAAKLVQEEIPHYCYHPDLTIAGNCRMCQVEVVGIPKLMIACHTIAQEGMEVKTHASSQLVKDAQAGTLEMILINHPLDCTVCDQAGHCKLQDYHYEYNARPSRFLEEKEHKVKALPLGPNVILDGERCIMCTRCIRFCDEITETSELGMLNRGDRSVIAINPGKELNNALSGTVVDLCPVGALTHRNWRFNTRIWYTKQTSSICPGCSTGCNVRVAVRDGQIVTVKSKYNKEVNKDWLCDEGRYGFDRFLPEKRLDSIQVKGQSIDSESLNSQLSKFSNSSPTLILLSPDLLFEEYFLLKKLISSKITNAKIAMAFKSRTLDRVEKILISPDYASNYKSAEYLGLVNAELEQEYQAALAELRAGKFKQVLLLGERAILESDIDSTLVNSIAALEFSLGTITNAEHSLLGALTLALPSKSILEKSGLLINSKLRLQYANAVLEAERQRKSEWQWLQVLATALGCNLTAASNDRDLTLEVLREVEGFKDYSIKQIKSGGVALTSN